MERSHFSLASSTALATAVSLLTLATAPNEVFELPAISRDRFAMYSKIEETNAAMKAYLSESEQAEILASFAHDLVANVRNLHPKVSQVLSDSFLEMYGRF